MHNPTTQTFGVDGDDAEEIRSELLSLTQQVRDLLLWEEQISGYVVATAERRSSDAAVMTHPPMAAPTPKGDLAAQTPKADLVSQSPTVVSDPRDDGRISRLTVLRNQVEHCTSCALHEHRTRTVFDRGDCRSPLAFVGEGPGYHEDKSGLPFVGPAGELLDRMIAAMGYAPADVYVCNVVKCRPPENRTPLPGEVAACAGYLDEQLSAVAPRIIVALGRCAAERLGCATPGSSGWRGTWGSWRDTPVMSTYHPAFLLRSPQFKRDVWHDLQRVVARLKED